MCRHMTDDGPRKASVRQAPRDGSPRVHGSAQLRNATLGRFTEVKERVQFLDSTLGDYSYIERDGEAIYSHHRQVLRHRRACAASMR